MVISHLKSLRCLAATVVCFALAAPVGAQQDSFRYYGTEEGLTSAAVKVLFQDRTGFLWVGTENGLFRYDGQRFQRYGSVEGLPSDIVLIIGEAPDGRLPAGYRGGFFEQKGQRFEKVPLPGANGVDGFNSILFDGKGQTFIATERGLVEAITPNDGSGGLWVHDSQKAAMLRHGNTRFDASNPGFPQLAGGRHMELDSRGRLLVPTTDGLAINEGRHFRTVGGREGLRGPVYSVLRDREGSIWLGLAGRPRALPGARDGRLRLQAHQAPGTHRGNRKLHAPGTPDRSGR
jgi:ligand-binding sensor domain-containing protein